MKKIDIMKAYSFIQKAAGEPMNYNEPLRPQIHFSPKRNWMNDPNGCVYYKGVYHLFFQYHPYGIEWGPMHWGHAESCDLIHWEEKEIALYPNEELGMAFSGSAVIDSENLTGFFPEGEGLLAYYTNHLEVENGETGLQQQSLAWSSDGGASWNEYENNPVIKNPGKKDFRDPKVFFHKASGKWIMVISGGTAFLFYSSFDLINWEKSGEFVCQGEPGILECPDLLSFITGEGRTVWLLIGSFITSDAPEKPAVRYFPGDFDGNNFSLQAGADNGFAVDCGRDFYASQSWTGIPREDGRSIWIGWCNHWAYSNQVPGDSWRGVMSLPRELYVDDTADGFVLRQLPVEELKMLRKGREELGDIGRNGGKIIFKSESSHEFLIEVENPSECSFKLSFNYKRGECWKLNWDNACSVLEMDRSGLESSGFNEFFGKTSKVEIRETEKLEMRIILDRSVVEIFAKDGRYVITSQIFPSHSLSSLNVETVCGENIKKFIHYTLDSIWKRS